MLTVAEKGFGKRTPLADYRIHVARRQGCGQY